MAEAVCCRAGMLQGPTGPLMASENARLVPVEPHPPVRCGGATAVEGPPPPVAPASPPSPHSASPKLFEEIPSLNSRWLSPSAVARPFSPCSAGISGSRLSMVTVRCTFPEGERGLATVSVSWRREKRVASRVKRGKKAPRGDPEEDGCGHSLYLRGSGREERGGSGRKGRGSHAPGFWPFAFRSAIILFPLLFFYFVSLFHSPRLREQW